MPLVIGVLLTFLGIATLGSGQLRQRHRGGPPLEGPLATIGGIFMVALGIFSIHGSFKRSEDATK